jgi:hypothetical protein
VKTPRILSPEDSHDGSPTHLAIWRAIGANPTRGVAHFTQLQQGVIDGQEPIAVIYAKLPKPGRSIR